MNWNVTLALTLSLLKICAGNFNLHISELISNTGTKSISDLGEHEETGAVVSSFRSVSELYPPSVGPTVTPAGSPLSGIRDVGKEELHVWVAAPQLCKGGIPTAGGASCLPKLHPQRGGVRRAEISLPSRCVCLSQALTDVAKMCSYQL